MIETCTLMGCFGPRAANSVYCNTHHNSAFGVQSRTANSAAAQINTAPIPSASDPARHGRRNADIRDGESSGGDVNYYRVFVSEPRRTDAYMAECEDIISALGMTFSEGSAFKSIWRKAAQRTLGHQRRGSDEFGIRDSEKVEYYGREMLRTARREAKEATGSGLQYDEMSKTQPKVVPDVSGIPQAEIDAMIQSDKQMIKTVLGPHL